MISIVQTIGRSPEVSERRGLESFSPVPYCPTSLKRGATTNFSTFFKIQERVVLHTLTGENQGAEV